MGAADELLRHAARVAPDLRRPGLPAAPARRVAVVACMDARIDVHALLGLAPGDAHVIRNAGAVVTDDVVRSLVISQERLGTREVLLIAHTDCGMRTFTDDELRATLRARTGREPAWAAGTFADLDEAVAAGLRALRASPFLPRVEAIRGFVLDVETLALREVA